MYLPTFQWHVFKTSLCNVIQMDVGVFCTLPVSHFYEKETVLNFKLESLISSLLKKRSWTLK